jgi:hypothetical protein
VTCSDGKDKGEMSYSRAHRNDRLKQYTEGEKAEAEAEAEAEEAKKRAFCV